MTGYFRENLGQTSPEGSGGCESVCVLPLDPWSLSVLCGRPFWGQN